MDVSDLALILDPLAVGGPGSRVPAHPGREPQLGLDCAQVPAQVAAHDRGAVESGPLRRDSAPRRSYCLQ